MPTSIQGKPLTLTMSKASNLPQDEDPARSQAREVELSDPALDDHERPLNKRGRRDGPRMGKLVRKYGLMPDVVISSDAVRARLTAEAVVQAARYAGEILLDQHSIWPVWPTSCRCCDGAGERRDLMIVGHNPGLEGWSRS